MRKKQLWAGLTTVVTLASVVLPLRNVYAQGLDGVTSSGDVPFNLVVDEETPVEPEIPTEPTDPETPTDPDDGETPEVPGDGETTEPETPENPDVPVDPEVPVDPPVDPEIPAEPEEPIESDYIITIPSGLAAKPEKNPIVEKKDLVDFAVTAKNVKLVDKQAVQVNVQAHEDYQVDGKNVLIGENGQTLGYSFEREPDVNYGFEPGFDAGDEHGSWTIAQFRDESDPLYTEDAPISIVTDDKLVDPGVYNSILKFTVSVVDTQANVAE